MKKTTIQFSSDRRQFMLDVAAGSLLIGSAAIAVVKSLARKAVVVSIIMPVIHRLIEYFMSFFF